MICIESSDSVSAAAFSFFLSVAAFLLLLLLIGGFLNLLVRHMFFLIRLMFRFVGAKIRLR